MKLLIFTQVVDTQHPVLGFFHGWLTEFAKHCDQIHVIALQVGHHDLPANVQVHSLGKEGGESRLKYIWRFYRYVWRLRNEYDNVFVHMSQIYVILGGIFWRVWGKKIGLWYAHGAVTPSLYISVLLSHIIFTSTLQGMRVKTKKLAIVGQGIDPTQFEQGGKISTDGLQLITISRVAQSKNIETLLQVAVILKEKGVAFTLKIIGGTSSQQEQRYEEEMRFLTEKLSLTKEVWWVGPLSHAELPTELSQADMFIHDGSTNSLDKALVEASFAGCIVLSSNPSYRDLTEPIAPELLFSPKDYASLAVKILEQYANRSASVELIKTSLLQTCSLPGLVSGIVSRY